MTRFSRLCLLGFFVAPLALHAQVISVNLAEDDAGVPRANQTLLSGDLAGAEGLEAVNWNNALFSAGSLGSLNDDSGTSTTASVSWQSANAWGDGSANADADAGVPNAKLQRGYIDDTGTDSTLTLDITGIPYADYGLVLYLSSDNPGATHGDFSINGGPFIRGGEIINWDVQPSLDIGRNVLVIPDLSGPTLNILGDRLDGTRATISGFQLFDNLVLPEPDPIVTINRDTGQMTLTNPASVPFEFSGFAVLSDAGTFAPENWLSIDGNYDADGNSSVSSDDWLQFGASINELAEGTLGSGTLSSGADVDLGTGVWNKYFNEDVTVEFLTADGEVITADATFTGNNDSAFPQGDFNFDGVLDALDWPIIRDNFNGDLSGLTLVEAYTMGELTGDEVIDLEDLLAFQEFYNAANGAGAFQALVPEPQACLLAMIGGAIVISLRRRRGLIAMALICACCVGIASEEAVAQPIAIANHSFEDAGLDAGGWSDCIDVVCGETDPENWKDEPLNGTLAFAEVIESFSADGTAHLGISEGTSVTQDLTDTLAPNTVYTLTVASGNRSGFPGADNESRFGLTAGGEVLNRLQEDNASLIPENTFEDRRYVYVTGDSVAPGNLGVALGSTRGGRAHFDNIRLDAAPVESYSDLLNLRVDPDSGAAVLQNAVGFMDMDINYYEIRSPSGSLNVGGWNSLQDQDYEGNGAPGTGNGWEELGNLDNTLLAEFYLTGSSAMMGGMSNVNLGSIYAGGTQDLQLFYHLADGRTFPGPVFYDFEGVDVNGDFNNDGNYDCLDVDALVVEIAGSTNNPDFDLDGDGAVDVDDLNSWLVEAGAANLPSGNSYLVGDANLDGSVDVSDFNVWNSAKFTSTPAWCSGDFNADGVVDVSDFNLWNGNKFNSADGAAAVPEPAGWCGLCLAGLLIIRCLREKNCR